MTLLGIGIALAVSAIAGGLLLLIGGACDGLGPTFSGAALLAIALFLAFKAGGLV